MYPKCPMCGTQDCERMTRFMGVWYRCRRCGHQFKWP